MGCDDGWLESTSDCVTVDVMENTSADMTVDVMWLAGVRVGVCVGLCAAMHFQPDHVPPGHTPTVVICECVCCVNCITDICCA